MGSLGEGFESRHLVDLVLVLTLFEVAALALYRRRTGKGVRMADVGPNLVAGLCLMLALRAALSTAGWPWVALALMASGLAHAVDLRRRWQR